MSGQPRRLRVAATGPDDPVIRRSRFEQAHPDVVILVPAAGRWRAVTGGRTLGAWDLGALMDQLEEIYPPQDEPGDGSG